MFLVNAAMEDVSIGTAALIVVLGMAVVFFGLILLMYVTKIAGAIISRKKSAEPAAAPAAAPAPAAEPVKDEDAGADFNAAKMVLSPMVGVFYASPSPSDPPFVTVGSKVKKGDVLCIIEAMKLMNEITAEEDGEIIDICAANGSVVEYGQILFKLL